MKAISLTNWRESIWLAEIKKGKEDGFGKIYDKYVDKIYRFVFLKIDSKESAEEVTQDVFLKFWQYARQEEKHISNVGALLYRIARNSITDYYRMKGGETKQVEWETAEGNEEMIIDGLNFNFKSEDDKIDERYDYETIVAEIQRLPDKYKEAVILKFIEDLTISEIAEIVEKDEGNVRVIAHRALKLLRERLKTQKHKGG